MANFQIKLIDAQAFNLWQAELHYLKRPIIRSKLLAYGIFVDGSLVGGLLWATPHFTKKENLFGFTGLPDKWEVLMLARFYLVDGCGVIASQALMDSIGSGSGRGSHRKGWRLQDDWVREHPPRFPDKPFVPRLLISWSDTQFGHKGTIYKASGWEMWDITNSGGRRTGRSHWINRNNDEYKDNLDGEKTCWIMRLPESKRAVELGLSMVNPQESLFDLVNG